MSVDFSVNHLTLLFSVLLHEVFQFTPSIGLFIAVFVEYLLPQFSPMFLDAQFQCHGSVSVELVKLFLCPSKMFMFVLELILVGVELDIFFVSSHSFFLTISDDE